MTASAEHRPGLFVGVARVAEVSCDTIHKGNGASHEIDVPLVRAIGGNEVPQIDAAFGRSAASDI